MKKFLCLLTALMLMAVPMLSFAEAPAGDAEEYLTYKDADGRFTFWYPDTWTLLSKDTIDAFITAAEGLGNEQLTAMAQQAKGQIEQLGIIMLMSADYQANINLVCTDAGAAVDVKQLLTGADAIKSQLSGQIEGIEFTSDPQVLEVGNHQALLIEYAYELAGQGFAGAQCYVGAGTNLYVFTLTAPAGSATEYAEALGVVIGGAELN